MLIEELLFEKKEKKKKSDLIFVEEDPTGQTPFPVTTISALERTIKKNAKDLEKKWKGAYELVEYVFNTLKIPKPDAHLKKRWEQYLNLLKVAVTALGQARGFEGNWAKNTV